MASSDLEIALAHAHLALQNASEALDETPNITDENITTTYALLVKSTLLAGELFGVLTDMLDDTLPEKES